MLNKPLEQVAEKDLQSLIDNAVSEGKTIEYKKTLQINSDSDKKEFLADVSSFANASGGDLIFGISAENETPKILVGIDIAASEITRIESIIRDGIELRLPSVFIQPILLSNSKNILIIRIAKSWLGPHRVIYKGHDKFYSRGTNGKFSLDVSELRIAFALSETLTERIKKFRDDRISKIYANEMYLPLPFCGHGKIILHLIPLISFRPAQRYEIKEIISNPNLMPPINSQGWGHKINFDGFITFTDNDKKTIYTYTQLYKNGTIEAVEGFLMRPFQQKCPPAEILSIRSSSFEKELISSLNAYLKIIKTIKIELPILLFLTLVEVKGYRMGLPNQQFSNAIDRDMLLLPEAIIENYDTPSEQILRPCFDAVWNACDFYKSPNYDENGKWMQR